MKRTIFLIILTVSTNLIFSQTFEDKLIQEYEELIDLYISFKDKNDNWGNPINMGAEINSSLTQRFPVVSPDGKCFFFMRHTPGQDFFWYPQM